MEGKMFKDYFEPALILNGYERDEKGKLRPTPSRDFINPNVSKEEKKTDKPQIGDDAGYPCPSCESQMIVVINGAACITCGYRDGDGL